MRTLRQFFRLTDSPTTDALLHVLLLVLAFAITVSIKSAFDEAFVGVFVLLFLAEEALLKMVAFDLRHGHTLDRLMGQYASAGDPLATLQRIEADAVVVRIAQIDDGNAGWIFGEYFRIVRDEFRKSVQQYVDGTIEVDLEDVSPLSERLPERLTKSAFCTALVENLEVYDSTRGKELFREFHDCAKRLGGDRFVRVYIADSPEAVKWSHYLKMRRDNEAGIKVLFLQTSAARALVANVPDFGDLDFGFWDGEFVMLIHPSGGNRRMTISRADRYLRQAKDLQSRILADRRTMAWLAFDDRYRASVNDWAKLVPNLIDLPPANGPSPRDCEKYLSTLSRLAREGVLRGSDAIVVLGLTRPLLSRLSSMIERGDIRCGQLICVDVRKVDGVVESEYPKVVFKAGNWLDAGFWKNEVRPKRGDPDFRVAAVLGDDVLANLGQWQFEAFFEILSSTLPEGAVFGTRVSARFDSKGDQGWDLEACQSFFADFFRNGGNAATGLTEGHVYELAWPALQEQEFSRSGSHTFDFGEWNKVIRRWRLPDEAVAKLLQHPAPTDPAHLWMTALPYDELRRIAREFSFSVAPAPVSSNWDGAEVTGISQEECSRHAERFRRYYQYCEFAKACQRSGI